MRKKTRNGLLATAIIAAAAFATVVIILGVPIVSPTPVLEFPIKETNQVYGLRAYGIANWSGPGTHHNGIDLLINASVSVISPVKGTVESITENQNQFSTIHNILFEITILINWGWSAHLVLEPNYPGNDSTQNSLQHAAIHVSVLQRVDVGQDIAMLLHENSGSHLHFMLDAPSGDVCPYTYCSASAQSILNAIPIVAGTSICSGS
ncbi:MAG TPA: hypothetical protein VKM55_06855 [Candidatus Lokiarchaeia archaeon]|nr:hypothetical protein [Candidatus Lokiarchaeia archaeon]